MFVFICSSHHLKYGSFPHLVVIVATLETPKNFVSVAIILNIMQNGNF